ncbi:hypothetical protein BN85406760 [Alteracholeplasma palmae J233]|uniref:Uncharacterized protein n=1 Tax=Alteracholeplasma palmae (strain ATCC 49389 / J233) TaxID=1318466 RepID=U4KKS4_ALTPJ|nr:hypothetical protein [Alteracholeplasma palmae]CCV64253.1 hypothetical protein BN85406760 [Alteracholeplasma palmae J233]
MNDLINSVEKYKNNKIRTTKRIHVFYEGRVTEKDLIELFNKEMTRLNIKEDILSFIDINVSSEPNNDLNYIIKTVNKKKSYTNTSGNQIYFYKGDYVLYLHDFDIYHDYRDSKNEANENRVKTAIRNFDIKFKEVNQNKKITFLIIPSFPSIEYPIALGCIATEELRSINISNKQDCIAYINQKTKFRITEKVKDFTNVLLSRAYSHDRMIFNCSFDRVNKKLLQNLKEFNSELLANGIDKFVANRNRSFSYLDGIVGIINDFYMSITK